jgi:hypothetical protein
MPPTLEQLCLDLPEPASERLEQLLAEELTREAADRANALIPIQRDGEELGDAA